MTTIKRFTPDYKMHAVRFQAFAREAEHGELVQFDAHQQVVSALEAERDAQQKRADALAVENQALKSAITGKAYIDFVTSNGWNPGMKTINGKFAGFMDAEIDFGCMAYDHAKKLIDAVETPYTDAALAAIEARAKVEAIELLIGRKKRELADMHPDTHAFGMTSALIRNHIRCLESFAAELQEAK